MWFAIIGFIVLVFGWFLRDRYRMGESIRKRGGMRIIYEKLISLIMEGDPNCRIIKETKYSVILSASTGSSLIMIDIMINFRQVTITYLLESMVFGKHKLRWNFQTNHDQEFMFFKMNNDIKTYLKHNRKTRAFFDLMKNDNPEFFDQ